MKPVEVDPDKKWISTWNFLLRNLKENLEFLLRTKKWNPYCLRHSAIEHDSLFLPGFSLHKKVRWSLNSVQPKRYLRRKMGNELKQKILEANGIVLDNGKKARLTNRVCYRCNEINLLENVVCSKCGYPLTAQEYEKIKKKEKLTDKKLDEVWQVLYKQGLIKKD